MNFIGKFSYTFIITIITILSLVIIINYIISPTIDKIKLYNVNKNKIEIINSKINNIIKDEFNSKLIDSLFDKLSINNSIKNTNLTQIANFCAKNNLEILTISTETIAINNITVISDKITIVGSFKDSVLLIQYIENNISKGYLASVKFKKVENINNTEALTTIINIQTIDNEI